MLAYLSNRASLLFLFSTKTDALCTLGYSKERYFLAPKTDDMLKLICNFTFKNFVFFEHSADAVVGNHAVLYFNKILVTYVVLVLITYSYVSSEGSDEPAHPRNITKAFATCTHKVAT